MTPADAPTDPRPPRHLALGAAGILLVASLATTTAARAEVTPAPSLPVAQGSTDVPYPAGAQGDAAVLLELVVEEDGTVSRAVVIEGAEPFAGQARQAVLAWRFVPALQGKTPIAARIRARVEFHQQQPPPATSSPTGAPRPAAVPAATTPTLRQPEAAPETALEVTVLGRRHEVGQTTISAADVREMPGAFGDPFRAIEALPGVTPIASGLPYFYVRGAPPNDNAYYVDGVRVPLLFHVGVGQGVIHPGLIERVDFFPGAAPAEHGGAAGAVIAGQTRAPAPAPHGEANLRIFDAGALVESPFAGGRGSALVAGRYGYPGPILGAVVPGLKLGYWDYQTRATWRLTGRDTLGVFAFGSHDYLATPSSSADATAGSAEQFASDFHRVDLRYDHELVDGRVRVAVTGGYDVLGADPSYASDRSAAVRLEVERKASPALRIRGGADARLDAYGFRENASGPKGPVRPSSANPPPTNETAGVHADVVWRVAPPVEIVAGARVDVFASSRADAPGGTTQVRTRVPAFDPRLSARVALTPAVAWLSTFGISHQYPSLRVGDIPPPIVSVPGFPSGVTQLQTALQVSQGLELALPAEIVLGATGFFSRWSGLTDLTAECIHVGMVHAGEQPDPNAPPDRCPDAVPVDGHAYGFELLVRRPLAKRLSGWLSYTLSRSTRDAHFLTLAGGDAVATVPSEADRTHVLNAVVAYQLGRGWRTGGRFVFFTGNPYSKMEGPVPVPPYNDQRFPAFYRLDVRLEKRWSFGKSGSIAFVLEGQNVTLTKEKAGIECRSRGPMPMSTTSCTVEELGPITIPSLGVEAFF
jgi:hypothetical protein